MKIKVLGCSGGIGPGRRTTSLMINDHLLLDAGTGVGDLSFAALGRITDVLLTHSHLDHVCGLALALDTLFERTRHPIRLHATTATIALLREHLFNWKLWPDFSALSCHGVPRLVYAPISPGEVRTFDGFTVTPFEVVHTVPAVGFALQAPGGTFAFSGDTYADESIWMALNALPSLESLMIEISFVDEKAELGRLSRHLTPQLLGRELGKLRHRPELLLTHHKPGQESAIERECATALHGWHYRHLRRGDLLEF